MTAINNGPVFLVTVRFKKRGLLQNEFTIRLASTEFSDNFTIEQLIYEGYKKLRKTRYQSFFLSIPQRILGYGKYIGYDARSVLAVYTEKDKGRIDMHDKAAHILTNNETIVVEYYDRNLFIGTSILTLVAAIYVGINVRKYIRYRIWKSNVGSLTDV